MKHRSHADANRKTKKSHWLGVVLCTLVLLFTSGEAAAHNPDGSHDDKCPRHVAGDGGDDSGGEVPNGPPAPDYVPRPMPRRYQLISSGRDSDTYALYDELHEELTKPGGVLEQLGIANPPQIATMAASGQINLLAALGRHAMPHHHDGAVLANSARSVGGVLEFVTPGEPCGPECPLCRPFYSDTTKPAHQLSVIFHVAGHNDFASHSSFCASRPCDPVAESLELSDLMAELYRTYDHDEVSRWYQWLLSLVNLQDNTYGTFQAPETFDPAHAAGTSTSRIIHAGDGKRPYPNRRHPRSPTPSVLQAFVANLPNNLPAWKTDMARRFEKMERVNGFYYSNKIMNEGWASLMQELIPPYTRFYSSAEIIEYNDLMAGVARPGLQNPYWLGREAWRILRKKFNARPEIRDLPQLEKDRRFIKWAHETVIAQMNDHEFLLYALDEQWIRDWNLYLHRKAEPHEWDPKLPPPKKPGQEQKIVISTDAKRVTAWIARTVADRRFQLPQIHLHDFNGLGRGLLDLRHDVVEDVPLERVTAAQTMYVIAQVMGKPVSLVTVAASSWTETKRAENPWGPRFRPGPWMPGPWDPDEPPWWLPRKETVEKVRYEVHPEGKVTAFHRIETRTDGALTVEETPFPELTKQLQEALDLYIVDIDNAYNDDLPEADRARFRPLISSAVDGAITPALSITNHAPTAGHALLEYGQMLKKRIARAVALAMSGTVAPKRTKRGVRLKVLPSVPEFRLDRKIAEKLKKQLPPAPIDPDPERRILPSMSTPAPATVSLEIDTGLSAPVPRMSEGTRADGNSGLGNEPGRRRRGDKFWGDPDDGKGKGDGDGDGDPDEDEDGEDGDDPNKGNDSGDPRDPTEVEIPHDLFARMVFRNFELPNPDSRLGGLSPTDGTIREGGVRKPAGHILWPRTIPAAMTYAREWRRRTGQPVNDVPQDVLLREGMRFLQEHDYVVSAREPDPDPERKAVIVYAIDLTGSMHGRPQEVAKQWVAYVDWLVKINYSGFEARFVGFADAAFEFSREEIFKAFINGGNTDSTGLILSDKIISEKKYEGWDKYVFAIGDCGSFDLKVHELQRKIYQKTRYSGWVKTQIGWENGVPEFMDPMKEMARKMPWFGWAVLEDNPMSLFRSIEEFFKQKKKK